MRALQRASVLVRRWGPARAARLVAGLVVQRAARRFREQLDENKLYVELEAAGFSVSGSPENVVVEGENLKLTCRRFSSDLKVVRQIFVDDEFRAMFELLQRHGVDVRYVVDAGGNIGAASVRLAQQYPLAKLVCVEPDSANLKIAAQNLAANSVNAQLLACGLWRDSRRLYFDRSFRDGAAWSITLSEEPVSEDFVDSMSIADIMQRHDLPTIDLLKIDIEGGERYIFDGSGRGLEFLERTRSIAIEIHDEFNVRETIVAALTHYGFELSTSGEYVVGLNTRLVPKFEE